MLGIDRSWATAIVAAAMASGGVRVPVRVVGDPALPVTGGVPMPRGRLRDGEPLRARTAAGRGIPIQSRTLSTWPDGSVRWLLVDVDPYGQRELVLESGAGPDEEHATARVAPFDDGLHLETGTASCVVSNADALLPMRIRLGDSKDVAIAALDLRASIDGREASAGGGEIERLAIDERGPVRVAASSWGRLASRDGGGVRVRNRVEAWAGRAILRMTIQLVAEDLPLRLDFVRVEMTPAKADDARVRFAIPGPAGGGAIGDVGEWLLEQAAPEPFTLREGSRLRQSGRRASGWVAIVAGDVAASLAIERFAELGPATICAERGRGVSVDLAPPGYELRAHSALRRDLVLALGPASAAASGPSARLPDADGWPVLAASPEWVADSGAAGPLTASPDRSLAGYERLATRLLDAHVLERTKRRAFGPRDFGDWPMGADRFGNLEFDTGLGLVLGWLRTGDRRWIDEARASMRHWRDVDVEWNGDRPGLPRMHGVDHGDHVECGHVWIEGTMLEGLVTGDPWALEAAGAVREAILGDLAVDSRTLALERGLGWSLLSVCAGETLAPSADLATRHAEVRRSLVDAILRAEAGRGFLCVRADAGDGESPRRFARVNPWVTLGITLEALSRACEIEPRDDVRAAIRRCAATIGGAAFEPKKGTVVGGLFFDVLDPTAPPRRTPPVSPDAAIFAARGLAHAAAVTGNASGLELARAVATRAVDGALESVTRFSGRERTRVLVAAPALLHFVRGR
ncbi:MAG: hypothetical protein HYR85_26640 [Planctomycetes bacterium]|nr:hypothetical protein [Planctomycetota bacterium]MBI3847917.1 hypothetical protein [Planctomycetota bacterium]